MGIGASDRPSNVCGHIIRRQSGIYRRMVVDQKSDQALAIVSGSYLSKGVIVDLTCGGASSWRRPSEIHASAPRALCPGYY